MVIRTFAVVALLAACHPAAPTAPIASPTAGISIALYDRGGGNAYSVVDDRRWVEITGTSLGLDNIDPGAALASLVIEPITDPALRVGHCVRDRIPDALPAPAAEAEPVAEVETPRVFDFNQIDLQGPRSSGQPSMPDEDRYAPVVRCSVDGASGRHLVRILYVSSRLSYRAEHDVTMTASERATVTTRLAITTPNWRERAAVTVFDGVPGGERPPREVARGDVTLDGSTAILAVEPRDVAARLRRVFGGAGDTDEEAGEAAEARDGVDAVWVWLELPDLRLAPGPFHVHVAVPGDDVQDRVVPADGRRQADRTGAPLRLPLWVDGNLHGWRQHTQDLAADAASAERFLISVSNYGEIPREVFVEEHLRAGHRRVERAWPTKPTAVGDLLRSKLVVRPGKIERVGYTVAYDP